MYYVYIIYNIDDHKFYTGITNDIVRRVEEHNVISKGSTLTTKYRTNFVLIHAEMCNNRGQARLREKFWKSGYGRELRNKMVEGIINTDA